MNKELLLKTADEIEKHPDYFEMNNWFNSCGTKGCIIGWAWHIYQNNSELHKSLTAWNRRSDPRSVIKHILAVEDLNSLAMVSKWTNSKLAKRFESATRPETKARIAAEYVRWFVEN